MKDLIRKLLAEREDMMYGVNIDELDRMTFKEFETLLNELSDKMLKKIFADAKNYPKLSPFYPSGFAAKFKGQKYLTRLTKHLVKSKAKESVTDLINIYYRGRKMEPGAIKIMEKAIRGPELKDTVELMKTIGAMIFGADDKTNGKLIWNHTATFKVVFMKMSKKQLNNIMGVEKDELRAVLEKLGIQIQL